MTSGFSLQKKLDRLEFLVGALIEERNGLRKDLVVLEKQVKGPGTGSSEDSEAEGAEHSRSLESMRSQLAESEAANQQLYREREQVRERLTQIKNRLDQVEAKLLEQRS